MNFLSNPWVAKLLWLGPLLLVVIAVGLVRAGGQQRSAAEAGVRVEATLDTLVVRERSEITRGAARLRYTLPGETTPTVRTVELPLAFLKELEEQEATTPVPIYVQAGNDQIVLESHARGQWIMTYAFAGMSAMGALGLAWMVWGWNRLLMRQGDPAHASG